MIERSCSSLASSIVSWFQWPVYGLTGMFLPICPFLDTRHVLWSSCRASCTLLSDDTIWISNVGAVLPLRQIRKLQHQYFWFFFIEVSNIQSYFLNSHWDAFLWPSRYFLIYHLPTRICSRKQPFVNISGKCCNSLGVLKQTPSTETLPT